MIDEKVFSIQVGDMDETSKITIGGYDTEKYAKGDLHWHNLKNELYWTLHMDGATLGENLLDLQSREVIIDSGTSYLLMPTADFAVFSKYFEERYDCGINQYMHGLYVCYADYSEYLTFPDIKV